MSAWLPRRLSNFVRVVVGLAAIGALLSIFDFRGVVEALLDISLLDLCVLFALSFALVSVSVIKWRAFLRRVGISAPLSHLFRLYLVGYFINLIMPSSLGGDVVRSLYVGKNVDKVRAVSATLLERYTGFLAMNVMALVAVCWAPQITPEIRSLAILIGVGAIGLTVFLLTGNLARLSRIFRLPPKVHKTIVRMEDALRWGVSDKGLLLRAAGLSLGFHLLTIVNTAAVAHAVGWTPIPWSDLLVIVPLILLIAAIPLAPQGLGIQEGAFLFFMHSVGATTGQALAIALVLRAKSYVLALIGGLMWLGLSHDRRKGTENPETLKTS